MIRAYTKKELIQISRDFSSILVAFLLPMILLFIFGFGINFDTNTVKIGVVNLDRGDVSRDVVQSFINSKYLDVYFFKTVNDANSALVQGKIRAFATIPIDFEREYKKNSAKIQIITDGSEPNTAKFSASYIEGAIQTYLKYKKQNSKIKITPIKRTWYNTALKSSYYILPGSLAIILTLTGIVLTALTVAKEWERGTMEGILTTKITKGEFLISKYIAYFLLSTFSSLFCIALIIFFFKVPFYGSLFWLILSSMLFMLTGIGVGILISTLTKDQFVSGQIAGTVGFMPSMMLSGLIYEIDSTPFLIRICSYLIPAKYYVSNIVSLFLSGVILKPLIINCLFLLIFSIFIGILAYVVTQERL